MLGGLNGAERTVRSFNCPVWGRRFVYKPITRAERDRLAKPSTIVVASGPAATNRITSG